MSENQNTTILSIKNEAGEWVDIPVFYQTAYQAYVAYCTANEQTPITIAQFYNVFNVLANTTFLQELIDTFEGKGALPINAGGTGADTAVGALRNLNC